MDILPLPMITRFNISQKKEYLFLLIFLEENVDYDFYYTSDNSRFYITELKNLKTLLKQSKHIFILKEQGEYVGIILIWKGMGGGKERYYVKINAKNCEVANKLLTVLLWNCGKKDLFIKLRKDNKYVDTFKEKGFRFIGGRGYQVLLKKIFKKDK